MTILSLYEKICECLEKLTKAAVIDDTVFELELLVTQLRIRLHAGVYDPLKKLDGAQATELSRFLKLVVQLDQFIGEADIRAKLVTEVAALAKTVLRNEGIPFRI
jgi:hypothetical protein